MGRDPSIMVAGQVTADIVSISYVRADDAKEFKYQCKEDGRMLYGRESIFLAQPKVREDGEMRMQD